MVFHTGDARVRSRQPTRHDVGNGIPLPPNVPLSCADVRHTNVNLDQSQKADWPTLLIVGTSSDSNKSNRSHGGGSSGRTTPAPQVLLRASGARVNTCYTSTIDRSSGNRGWRYRGCQNTGESGRRTGEARCFGTEAREIPENAQTTNLIALSFLTVAVGYTWAAAALWMLP